MYSFSFEDLRNRTCKNTKRHQIASTDVLSLIVVALAWLHTGCVTESYSSSSYSAPNAALENPAFQNSPGISPKRFQLKPKAKISTLPAPPVVQYVYAGSPADKVGLRPRDKILSLNDQNIKTGWQFEYKLRNAPTASKIVFQREGRVLTAKLNLSNNLHRLGALFEPQGIPIVREWAPLVPYIHSKTKTVFAEASVNSANPELTLNFIVQSDKIQMLTPYLVTVYDKSTKKILIKTKGELHALGLEPMHFSTKTYLPKDTKGPLFVSVAFSEDKFLFEFQ